jgi:hypothetical protein
MPSLTALHLTYVTLSLAACYSSLTPSLPPSLPPPLAPPLPPPLAPPLLLTHLFRHMPPTPRRVTRSRTIIPQHRVHPHPCDTRRLQPPLPQIIFVFVGVLPSPVRVVESIGTRILKVVAALVIPVGAILPPL